MTSPLITEVLSDLLRSGFQLQPGVRNLEVATGMVVLVDGLTRHLTGKHLGRLQIS